MKTCRATLRVTLAVLVACVTGMGGGFGTLRKIEDPPPTDQVACVADSDDAIGRT
jgi:hypothetical protein